MLTNRIHNNTSISYILQTCIHTCRRNICPNSKSVCRTLLGILCAAIPARCAQCCDCKTETVMDLQETASATLYSAPATDVLFSTSVF